MIPNDGVGLARLEFIITEYVKAHPMALAHPERIRDSSVREDGRCDWHAATRRHPSSSFRASVKVLARSQPRSIQNRSSCGCRISRPTNMRELLGGADFEPAEPNPMIGFRGASRYAHPAYEDGFALECAALKRVRESMGLTNVKLMIPFCRRVEEAKQRARVHGQARTRTRSQWTRGVCHVRDSEQRDLDRCVCRAFRRLLDRLERPDSAHAWCRPRFRDGRFRFRRARSRRHENARDGGCRRRAQQAP